MWYYFGGMTLFLFVIQVGTGGLLLLYYRPSAAEAYEAYLRDSKERGRSPRLFAHLPHVLVSAPVDVAGLRLVRG